MLLGRRWPQLIHPLLVTLTEHRGGGGGGGSFFFLSLLACSVLRGMFISGFCSCLAVCPILYKGWYLSTYFKFCGIVLVLLCMVWACVCDCREQKVQSEMKIPEPHCVQQFWLSWNIELILAVSRKSVNTLRISQSTYECTCSNTHLHAYYCIIDKHSF